MTALADRPQRTIIAPSGEWRGWFLREIAALNTPSVDYDAEYRRAATEKSPLRFAFVYLSHHLVSSRNQISFSEFHLEVARNAKSWRKPVMARDAWIAPRGAAKSTWFYLILPLWALCHGHRKFFLSFAYNEKQAVRQLNTLRRELRTNALLTADFPEMVPARGKGSQDNSTMVVASGATIATSGLGGTVLGVKSGSARPDLMLGDDLEPNEGRYSPDECAKLLNLLLEGILPMGDADTVTQFTGTVTMYNSIMHQVVRHARGVDKAEWIDANEFRTHYFPGVIEDLETGAERSLWPQRWPLTPTHLGEHRRITEDGRVPRAFQLNYLLDPTPESGSRGGGFWREELFVQSDSFHVLEQVLYIDPALQTAAHNDPTAIVVVSIDPSRRKACVEYARAQHQTPEEIRQRVLRLLRLNPDIRTVVVEANAAGSEHWRRMLRPVNSPNDWPRSVRLRFEWASGHKSDRIKEAASHYERGEVVHRRRHKDLEEQALLWPDARQHDDLLDSLSGALRALFGGGKYSE